MAVSPFARSPESAFFARIAPIVALSFVVACGGLGWARKTSRAPAATSVSGETITSEAAPLGGMAIARPLWAAAERHYQETWAGWMDPPKHCRGDAAVNDLQREHCAKYWSQVSTLTAWAAMPFGVALLFFLFVRSRFRGFYTRVDRRFREGKAVAGARVLKSGGWDAFSFFFCLSSVWVELGKGRSVRIYVPRDVPALIPGQKVALFYGGKIFGARRYAGLLYAPHIAILAGPGR